MTDVDDILTMQEAAEIAGRTPDAMRKACQRGKLDGKRVGGADHRGTWVTTRAALTEYMAWSRSRSQFLPRDEHGRIVARRTL